MQINRLFQIIYKLLQGRIIPAKELADEFNVSVRTIYRDIDILSSEGVPVYYIKGRNGGIAIMDEYKLDKTFFTSNERDKLLLAMSSLNAAIPEKNNLIDKLKGVFKSKSPEPLEIIHSSSWCQEDMNTFKTLIEAVNKFIITFEYSSAKDTTTRTVEPHKLSYISQGWYLKAYCRLRNDFRFFKLNRIKKLIVTDEKFIPREMPEETFINQPTDELRIVCKISKMIAFRVYDEFPRQNITESDDEFFIDVNLPDEHWLPYYLLSYGDVLTLLEPKSMKDTIAKIAKNLVYMYDKEQ